MDIVEATGQYETWLGSQIPLIREDLAYKHRKMAEDPFSFLRATYYRWAQLWPTLAPELATAPKVLAVGDLHIENFGTWRDGEGRLAWGINDFDEAYPTSYAIDLVRLAVSAHLAIKGEKLSLGREEACGAILEGYARGLDKGGAPYVLAENHGWLRDLATNSLRDPEVYWDRLAALPPATGAIPDDAASFLRSKLPASDLKGTIAHRIAGVGSLGRRRYTLVAEWRGGHVAREVKQLACSASAWQENSTASPGHHYAEIVRGAIRVPDPYLDANDRWVCRRLAPDCNRIELGSLPRERDEAHLLHAMGFETANVHLGSAGATGAVIADLRRRPNGWLHAAAELFIDATMEDWNRWRKAIDDAEPRNAGKRDSH